VVGLSAKKFARQGIPPDPFLDFFEQHAIDFFIVTLHLTQRNPSG
jgi:hypothetical protein